MAELIKGQLTKINRMSRAVENFKKGGSARINPSTIKARTEYLDRLWSEFSKTHDELSRLAVSDAVVRDSEYFKEDCFTTSEDTYLEQRDILFVMLDDLEQRAAPVAANDSGQNCSTLKDARPRALLPRVDIPKFDGKLEEWPSFRDLFTSLVINDETLSDIERFHYLRTSVTGNALLRLRNLPITEQNFTRAWDLMVGRYQKLRLLVSAQINILLAIPVATRESASELRRIIDTTADIVESLASLSRPLTTPGDLLVQLTASKLDKRTRREWEDSIGALSDPSAFERLRDFCEARINSLEAQENADVVMASPEKAKGGSKGAKVHQTSAQKQKTKPACPVCSQGHILMLCPQYRTWDLLERKAYVARTALCVNCLGRHPLDRCRSERRCQVCQAKHHTSLHEASAASSPGVSTLTSTCASNPSAILLATAMIRVHNGSGQSRVCRALIDSGSQVSLITEDVVQGLYLPRERTKLPLYGVSGEHTSTSRGAVQIELSSRLEDTPRIRVHAFVLAALTSYQPMQHEARELPARFHALKLADPDLLSRHRIDLLLGADVYASVLEEGLVTDEARTLMAQNSMFGWLVLGRPTANAERVHQATSLQLSVEPQLQDLVERFWNLEEPETAPSISPEDEWCEQHFAATHERTPEGRYVVRLPLKTNFCLGESRKMAAQRLFSLERRFDRYPALREAYSDFMDEYEKLGHMERCEPAEGPRRYYLPHHGVHKVTSATTKLRVVFNASQATSNGVSLNDMVHSGPNLLPCLQDVLMRWRTHRVALVTDIVKMYRQILVHPADRHLQCILWRSSADSEPLDFQLCTVTYGMSCAPYLAIRTLRQLASDSSVEFPRASKVMMHDVYVDDVLTGTSTVGEAKELVRELSRVCAEGGFPLQKWRSNFDQVFAGADRDSENLELTLCDDRTPILGVQWCAASDVFKVTVHAELLASAATKRAVLSQIARLYDPIGWLAPVIVWAKCFMQDLWMDGIGWDVNLPDRRLSAWQRYQGELPRLATLTLSRWLQFGSHHVELHGFADASERAYAAVVYVRSSTGKEQVKVTLLGAKTKVAPLKRVSLPRLELNAAHLLAKFLRRIIRVLGWHDVPLHCWSDSTIVLHWVTSHSSQWKTYVANRTAEIQHAVPSAQWHHVQGECNPADVASRGVTPAQLASARLWWDGPSWLYDTHIDYSAPPSTAVTEERRVTVHVADSSEKFKDNCLLARFSVLEPLLRISCWCLRWRRSAGNPERTSGISAAERKDALLRWVRIVQEAHFADELRILKKKQPIPEKSRLSRLSPFLDERGIIRVGGRLANSFLPSEGKQPFVLPANSTFTELFIRAAHLRTLHGGAQLTLAVVRQEAWPLRGRQVTKSIIRRCLRCIRWNASPMNQKMSHLPADRVRPSRPFSCVGVDYAGPVTLRTALRRSPTRLKGYIALFVCMATRAVHLELVSSYDSDSFLAAFRRFTGRRGLCSKVYSDRGTNFIGAERELRQTIRKLQDNDTTLQRFCVAQGIEWHFNPPAAPHFGGLWEAGVKSVKGHLRRVLGDQALNFEEFDTLLVGVEACLNSRPLQAMSDDPSDLSILTPGHFLTGSPLLTVPEYDLLDIHQSRLSRWQLTTRMMQHFWRRWSREFLNSLQQRSKWRNPATSPSIGDLVLVVNELLPPSRWPVARITALHQGNDGFVRVATIRTATSELLRPLCKLVPLPPAKDELLSN